MVSNMKNSQQFKLKLTICKISCVLITFAIIYLLIKYVILNLIPYFGQLAIILIGTFIIGSIFVLAIYYMINLNKLSKLGKEKIYEELDNNIEKIFKEFGLYITKNYIVCLGSKINIFKLFVVPISSINAIDTHNDSRYFYQKRGIKNKHKFLSFLKSSIKYDILFSDNREIHVFNIICDEKVYSVTTSHVFNKSKLKKIDEIADYMCEKYKDIDYI